MKLLSKIKNLFSPKYQVVYRTLDGRTELYTINKPQYGHEFGNNDENRNVVGFRSYCHNRHGIRSFRYDRVVALERA
mgnify:FL=1|jgi:hypothetical protein